MIELDEQIVCQEFWTIHINDESGEMKREVKFCKLISTHRVNLYDGEVYNEDNKKWEKQIRKEYYCKNHFDRKYKYQPSSIHPPFTYQKIRYKKEIAIDQYVNNSIKVFNPT